MKKPRDLEFGFNYETEKSGKDSMKIWTVSCYAGYNETGDDLPDGTDYAFEVEANSREDARETAIATFKLTLGNLSQYSHFETPFIFGPFNRA